MDKKRSLLNIMVSIVSKMILLIFTIVLRRCLIKYVGNEANGIFSLYTSIIGFLAVAELGVGTAINFSMYKPIVDNDVKKVSALYNLYKKVYLAISLIILAAGLIILPFLPVLAKDYSNNFSLQLTFLIMLIDVVITYFYSCKTSLINAYKNNYITTAINAFTMVIRSIAQIIILVFTRSFVWYLVIRIGSTLLEWLLTNIYVGTQYKTVINTKEKIDKQTRIEIVKNTKAMFMHKIGGLLVNTVDSIIISSFIGVIVLGLYSNYIAIVTAMYGVLSLLFSSLTSIIGHLCAEKNLDEEKKYFKFLYLLNFATGIIFFLGFYAVIDDIIAICFGADLIMDSSVVFIITLNYFIQYLRVTVLVYREATGTFYYDRWKPLIEGIINVVLSILFVLYFSVVGVIVATIITNIFICHIVEPHVLYKYGFKQKATNYYLLNFILITVFTIALTWLYFLKQKFNSVLTDFFVNGFISVGISVGTLLIMFLVSKTFRENTKKLFKYGFKLITKRKRKNLGNS